MTDYRQANNRQQQQQHQTFNMGTWFCFKRDATTFPINNVWRWPDDTYSVYAYVRVRMLSMVNAPSIRLHKYICQHVTNFE